jgi:uncharacterized repeat protein (TIGR01451 family)
MRLRSKLGIVAGAVIFSILAGTGVSYALWSTQATATGTVKVADLADNCTNVTSMLNASFEEPVATQDVNFANDGVMPGWRSKNTAGQAVRIEYWKNNAYGVNAPVGNQFVELNADVAGTLYQSLSTTPGQTLQWSLLHRARQGNDTMQLSIGAVGAPVSQGQFTDSTAGWVRYSGAYVVPAGQTTTELSFIAISTGSGNASIGNFLDDVSFGSGPCVTASSTVASATPMTTNTVTYTTTVANSGSSPSSSTLFSTTIPAGLTYVPGTLAVNGVAGGSVNGSTLTVGLGTGATATAGGQQAQGTSSVVTFQAVVNAAAGTVIDYTPTVTYANGLALSWTKTVTAANAPLTVAADTVAPGKPGTPVASGTAGTQTTLSWTASTDNVGVTAYDVYRSGTTAPVGTVDGTTLTFTDTGLTPWSSYTYTVKARDAAGNTSVASNATTVVITPAGLTTTAQYRLTPQNATTYCLANSSTSNNGTVSVGTSNNACTSSDARDWSFVPDADGYAQITLSSNLRYLTATQNSTTVSATGTTTAGTGQDWKVTRVGTTGANYTIESRIRPGYCLDHTNANSTTVVLAVCAANPANDTSQVWGATAR